MGIKKWLWAKVGPSHEPRWLFLVMGGLVLLAVLTGLSGS